MSSAETCNTKIEAVAFISISSTIFVLVIASGQHIYVGVYHMKVRTCAHARTYTHTRTNKHTDAYSFFKQFILYPDIFIYHHSKTHKAIILPDWFIRSISWLPSWSIISYMKPIGKSSINRLVPLSSATEHFKLITVIIHNFINRSTDHR